ncbi:MAG TPA: hypothetical protein DDY98_06780 [Ruminococcaceae bacterium]|nr:hypothetical protein [Oscillospiraceae bacterium]
MLNHSGKSKIAFLLSMLMLLGIVTVGMTGCGQKPDDAETTAAVTDNETTTQAAEITETTAAQESTAESTTVLDETTLAETTAGNTTAEATTAAEKLTAEQIIEKFNTASNDAKSNAKSIKQNYCNNTQVDKLELNNKVLAPVADKLIKANMGHDETKENVVYKTPSEKVNMYPVGGQTWASKLTKDDVKSATITKNGNTSTVTIKLKDDLTPNKGTHTGKVYSLVTKQQIVDGAGSIGMKFIKEDSIKLTYKNAVIKAKIDETTGRLISSNYYIEWGLALSTTVGLDVALFFGIESDYVINW